MQLQANDLKSLCLLDWQFTRYCSPALDIYHVIFGASDKKLRDQHYEQLLEAYYASLSGMVRRLGSNPDQLFTYRDLKDELLKFGEFALICTTLVNDARFDKKIHDESRKFINEFVCDLFEYGYLK